MNLIKAGEIQAFWDKTSIRYISVSGIEIIRMVYPALRVEGWLTIEPEIEKTECITFEGGFKIIVNCKYQNEGVDFKAVFKISGSADNTLSFEMDGTALSSFKKNRIGFCILHPVEGIRGQKCNIVHSDGSSEDCTFPYYISPYQPFKEIKEIKWMISDFIAANLTFSGDVFETEDQRNWTDNSYKTYCTPLDRPYPVMLEKDEKVFQSILLKVDIEKKVEKKGDETILIQTFPDKEFKFPGIGVGRTSRAEPISDNEIELIRNIPFDHYRVDLFLFDRNWQDIATTACAEANKLGFMMELALFFDKDASQQLKEFISWAESANPRILMLHIFDKKLQVTPDTLIRIVVPGLRKEFPEVRLGGGTNANFAQLNRAKMDAHQFDFLSFSIHPQEHAIDDISLVENIEAQKYTVESLRHRFNDKDIVISPVTLKRRFNANVENYETKFEGEIMPLQIDPRQLSAFAALWTLGSLKYLLESGVSDINYYETVGERGFFQGSLPSRWPDSFKSYSGMIFPVFYLLKYILKNKDAQIIQSKSSSPLSVEVLVFKTGCREEFIVANFMKEEVKIKIEGFSSEAMLSTFIDEFSGINAGWDDKTKAERVSLKDTLTLPALSLSSIRL